MRSTPLRQLTRVGIIVSFIMLSLSSLIAAPPPGEAQRMPVITPAHIAALGGEQAGAPPVKERQDGPLPPEIFP